MDRAKEMGEIEGFVVVRTGFVFLTYNLRMIPYIFSSKEERNVGNLLTLLRIFEVVSGLKVNLTKSCVVRINLEFGIEQRMADFLGCSIEKFPLKYLGLPLKGG